MMRTPREGTDGHFQMGDLSEALTKKNRNKIPRKKRKIGKIGSKKKKRTTEQKIFLA